MRETSSPAVSASPVQRRTYSAHDVARLLGMSTRWVLYMAKKGELPCLRFGRRVLFLREKIDELIPAPGSKPH